MKIRLIILRLQSILVKRIFLLFVAISAISCTKENVSKSVVGNWVIIERAIGTGSGYTPAPIVTQRSLTFNMNGTFQLSDSDTSSFLNGFNQYEVQPDQKIRFFNTTSPDAVVIEFKLDDNLLFYYPARCGFYERFTRQ